ncbi:extracellular calcium-sensing receptor-like [Polypterus senegalus]|uniref:extracellular calcium-sensing receptor-like n=1 Tax=Polypterus senegalus TaxID=55291 RepID=UPI0019626CEF|nr:extracellular calcium-sensing receptor-like [Polypterus senegalus]
MALAFPAPAPDKFKCKSQGKFAFNSLYKPGNIMLGAIFAVNFRAIPPELSYRSKPEQWKCDSFDIAVFQRAQAMVFAIEEINQDQTLLPNLTLGYKLYDNCVNLQEAMRATASLIGGEDYIFNNYQCHGVPPVIAIIGDPLSLHSISISRILALFGMPLISYCATCSCLSNKQEFPTFFRTIPSDTVQVRGMTTLMKHFGWTWVGAVGADDDYGLNALLSFKEEVEKFGCVAFSETININDRTKIFHIINIIKQSSANIIVLFLTKMVVTVLMKEIVHQNITGRQWIASDPWSAYPVLASNENFASFGGTIGFLARRAEMPGFEQFLLQTKPSLDPNNNLLAQFWEALFRCKFSTNDSKTNASVVEERVCTGSEDIKSTKTEYTDVSQIRASFNVYKAVYAIAHALHKLASCENGKGPFGNNTCAYTSSVQPWQVFHYLKNMSFTTRSGDRMAFDENGDTLPVLDIINWQKDKDGTMISKTVGFFNDSAAAGQKLTINESNIFWNFDSGKTPKSICTESCQPGTRIATRKGEPVCCFDCVPCADGEISSGIGATECLKCPQDFWSNDKRSQCVLKEIDFLSFGDAMGITLTTTASIGVFLSLGVLGIFVNYRNTPVVKANNSELSFLLLGSLTLCFLCSLCFIGQPSDLTCRVRHVAFGISFVLCISCILVKTIVVIIAFKATLPGNNIMKWFGVTQQRGTILFFTIIQMIICIIWLNTAPPFSSRNTKNQNVKIIFECDVGSVTGFSCLLGYIGLLSCVCFILAFLARNLPDTFNEAKFITFSMLIFCAVWVTFIPAYVSSPGKYTVAVEVFAILASSFGLLVAIFAPKCYIILLRPDLNTKKALLGREQKNK